MWNFETKMENSRTKIAPSLCKSINFWLEKKRSLKNIHQNLLPLVTHSVQCCKNNSKNGKRSGISNYCKVHYLLLLAK